MLQVVRTAFSIVPDGLWVRRRVLGVSHRVLGVLHRALGVLHRVLGVLHRVLGVPHRVPGVPHRVLGVLRTVLGGSIRTARARRAARRPIFWWPRKKLADLDLPHKSQEECAPRGVSKVSPYFEVDESIFSLSFTKLHGFVTVLSNQPKIRSKYKVGWVKQHDMT